MSDYVGETMDGWPLADYWAYVRIASDAYYASKSLHEAWRRPVRHNRRLERAALFHTVLLDQTCERAMPTNSRLLLPPETNAETRYELQAGVHTVRAIVPFSSEERQLLRADAFRGLNTPGEGMFEREDHISAPHLAERWHEWLWLDEAGAPQRSVEALGASAVLAEACVRLSDVVSRELLGRET